jgi:hypothetical protein
MEDAHNKRIILKLNLGARRIPKTLQTTRSRSVATAHAGVRSPVCLNVTGLFTIARTRQQLLIQITTSKISQMSPSERHFIGLTKQAIPRKLIISVFLLPKLSPTEVYDLVCFLFSVAQRPTSARGCVRCEVTVSHTHEHVIGRSPPNDLPACCKGRYLHNPQQTQQTNIHALSGIRSRNPIRLTPQTARPPGSAVCNSVTHNMNVFCEATPC